MSKSLGPKLCKELARVVPEVRERDTFHEGDLFYVARPAPALRAMSLFGWLPLGKAEDGLTLWHPSLSDLLSIACARGCFGWLAYGRSLCADRSHPWECGNGDADLCGPEDCASGDTPEEAVARWLIANAKGGEA